MRYYWESKLQDSQYLPSEDFEMFEPTEADYASVQEALKVDEALCDAWLR